MEAKRKVTAVTFPEGEGSHGPLIAAAIVAGAVSLIVALVSTTATHVRFRGEGRRATRRLEADREAVERQLERRLTERLYEARLQCYPDAFRITEQLRTAVLRQVGENDTEHYHGVWNQLAEWYAEGLPALSMSRESIARLYALQGAIHVAKPNLYEAWWAKHLFRQQLRADLGLLFEEDMRHLDEMQVSDASAAAEWFAKGGSTLEFEVISDESPMNPHPDELPRALNERRLEEEERAE